MNTKYRINGFEQIHRFFNIVKSNMYEIKPYHISLYLYFIDLNNSLAWVEWFKCSYESAMNGACIGSNKTYYKALSELKEFGLIDYKKGINELLSPQISIKCLCKNTEAAAQLPTQAATQIYISDNLKSLINNSLSKENESESSLNFLKKDYSQNNNLKGAHENAALSSSIKTQVSRQEKKRIHARNAENNYELRIRNYE